MALSAATSLLPEVQSGSSQLRQVLRRYQRVFTEELPVKTAQQIAEAVQFSIVLVDRRGGTVQHRAGRRHGRAGGRQRLHRG